MYSVNNFSAPTASISTAVPGNSFRLIWYVIIKRNLVFDQVYLYLFTFQTWNIFQHILVLFKLFSVRILNSWISWWPKTKINCPAGPPLISRLPDSDPIVLHLSITVTYFECYIIFAIIIRMRWYHRLDLYYIIVSRFSYSFLQYILFSYCLCPLK